MYMYVKVLRLGELKQNKSHVGLSDKQLIS